MHAKTIRSLTAALAVTVVAAGLVGCSDDDGGDASDAGTTTTGGAPGEVAAAPSAGCTSPEDVATEAGPEGQERVTTTSGGQDRWYLRHVPEAHDGSTPVPLVVDFHGYSEGAEVHVQMSALSAYGDEQGFVTVTPHGEGEVPRWDTTLDGGDMDFVGDLLDEVEASLCVDTNRIYVTGLSNGAFLTSAIACRYADRVAAVAPVAGVRDVENCEPARPVPLLAIHGTEDEFVTFDGTPGDAVANLPAPDGSGRTIGELRAEGEDTGRPAPPPDAPTIPEIVAAWAERNGCEGPPAEEPLADDVALERYDCPTGADTGLIRIDGGGHSWPGSELSAAVEEIVGHTTMSISANEVMWEFFLDHPLTAE